MVAAKQYHKRVVQVGQWQRSNQHWADAIAYVQSGGIGHVRKVKAWAYMGWMKRVDPQPDQATPAGVDYDRWLGPASLRPFNPNRFHFSWRWYWDYAGGLMTDWGVHLMDIALLGMKAEAPRSVSALGGAYGYPGSAMETPDTQTAIYDFGDYSMEWEHAVGISKGPYGGHDHGVAFVGETGTLVVDRSKWRVIPEVADDKPLIMATIVNIDALEQTSMLGRLVSEQVSTRLAQGGLKMLEMKLRNSVYLKRNQGELMLTREIGEQRLAVVRVAVELDHGRAVALGRGALGRRRVLRHQDRRPGLQQRRGERDRLRVIAR